MLTVDTRIGRRLRHKGQAMGWPLVRVKRSDQGLLTEQDVAGVLEVSLSTLRRWQREGTGPPCLEIGRQVRYRRAAVERWSTGSIQAGSPDENR